MQIPQVLKVLSERNEKMQKQSISYACVLNERINYIVTDPKNEQKRGRFRAKRVDNKEWAVGNRIDDGVTGQVFIHVLGNTVNESDKVGEEGCLQFTAFEADPATICQCTEWTDKTGTLLFEHDIVTTDEGDIGFICYGQYDLFHVGFYVEWKNEKALHYRPELGYWASKVIIIGNAFDNPKS